MIITDDFVMLLFPKTGTTAVRAAIEAVYQKHGRHFRMQEQPNLLNPDHPLRTTQHGGYSQIPAEAQGLPVVAVLRNVHRSLISLYAYMRWQVSWVESEEAMRQFPDFPHLGFEQFLDFSIWVTAKRLREVHHNPAPPARLGVQSYRFLLMFCRDPESVLGKMDDDYIESGAWLDELCEVKFLQHHRLHEELKTLLGRFGFPAESLGAIDDGPKKNLNPNIRPGERPGEWRVDLADFADMRKNMRSSGGFKDELSWLFNQSGLVSLRETIAPEPALIERIRADERVVFRFAEENRSGHHALSIWEPQAMTAWPGIRC